MSLRRYALSTFVGLLVLLGLPGIAITAYADPLPADYAGSTHGDVLSLDVAALGLSIDAALGHSATAVDSTTDPRSRAESANLHGSALGIPVSLVAADAESTNSAFTDSYSAGLGEVDVPPLLAAGLVTGSGSTTWAGQAACVPDGTPIAQSTTSLAGAQLGIPDVNILSLGAVQTTGTTTLQGGSVVSTTSGNVASLSLINDLVGIFVLTQPTITATSDGTTGSFSANAYAVRVTAPGVDVVLTAGASAPISLTIPDVANVSLTISVGALDDTSADPTGSGDTTFLRIQGLLTQPALGTTLAGLDIGLLPLAASATGAPGGIECDALDPPIVTSPADGDTTGETPTITGTGVPGATVTVSEGATEIGTAVVAAEGTWWLPVTDPLAVGEHTITATQSLGGITSEPSATVTFTVADQTPPGAPVSESPTDGSVIATATPTVSGTGEPGATVEVSIDGQVVGTATVDPGGSWSLPLTDPLSDGPHTISASQTDAAGNTSTTETVDVVVDTTITAPEITSPADGSTTGDPTPLVEGTGEPSASVEVTVDGEEFGTTAVNPDGTWSLLVTDTLDVGEHTVTAAQTDETGNLSQLSTVTFTVAPGAPAPPVITSPTDGETITDTTPNVSGTGEPGALVEVLVDGDVAATATVDTEGNWSVTLADPTNCGDRTLTATQTAERASRSAGPARARAAASAPSDPVSVTVSCADGADDGWLPETGATAGTRGLALLGLILLGMGLLLIRRRRS